MGTGAFTSVEADRRVDVNVSDDAGAYLRLQGTGGPNSPYVTQDGNGNQLEIDLTDSNDSFPNSTDPNGVNPNALTQIDDLFVIQNQGTQEVDVGVTKSGNNPNLVTFYANDSNSGLNDRYDTTNDNTVALGTADATLATGDIVYVSLEVDTSGSTVSAGTQILNEVTVEGDAT